MSAEGLPDLDLLIEVIYFAHKIYFFSPELRRTKRIKKQHIYKLPQMEKFCSLEIKIIISCL